MNSYLLIFEDGAMKESESFDYSWVESIDAGVLSVIRTDDDGHFQELDAENKWSWLERL